MSDRLSTFLEVRALHSSYAGRPLLQNIDLKLAEGEIMALLGPSGSGKTTLLRIIAGLEAYESGDLLFKGNDVSEIPPHRRNFGMMFQEYALFPHKNVFENIAFGLEMLKWPTPMIEQKVKQMLEMIGLGGLAGREIDELSGGERQRVALARSLAPEPDLLLLDEPLGSLDRALRERLTDEIRQILKNLGVTALFVTHDQREAFTIADRVAILHNGLLQQVNTPELLYRQPANRTVAQFLGFRNIVQGQVTENGQFISQLSPFSLDIPYPPGPAAMLIRPDGALLNKPLDRQADEITTTLTYRSFQGNCFRIGFEFAGCQFTFDVPIDPVPPAVGEAVTLWIISSARTIIDLTSNNSVEEK